MKNFYLILTYVLLYLTTSSQISPDSSSIFDYSLEDLMNLKVEVSSTNEQDIFRTNSSVIIIDRYMIEQYNFQTITEALQTVAGFAVYRTYLKRDIPTARGILQDHYANKVLILINNKPVWNAVTGEGILARISINDVERIEILKGPASGKYGTNAYSGVVNIILKNSKKITTSPYIGLGSTFAGFSGINVSGQKNDFSFTLGINYFKEKGFEHSFTDETDSTGMVREYLNYANTAFAIKYKSHSILINYYNSDESFLGVVPKFSKGIGNNHNVSGFLANYSINQKLSNKLTFKFSASYDFNHRNLSRSADDIIRANILGYRIYPSAQLNYSLNEKVFLFLGADLNFLKSIEYKNYNTITGEPVQTEFANMTLDGFNGMSNRIFIEKNIFTGLSFNSLHWGIDGLFRYMLSEKNSIENIFGNLTFVFRPNSNNSLKLITGRSYRNPSLFEKFFFYKTVLGNQNLKPEIAESVEFAYLHRYKNLFVQNLVYYSIYSNKIFRIPIDTVINNTYIENINIYQNGNTFNAWGVETEIKYINPQKINFFLNFNYVMGNNGDEINGKYNFRFVPKYKFSFGISKNFKNLSLSAYTNYMSKVNGYFEEIPAQYTINLNFSYTHKVKKFQFTHSLFGKNILNSMYYYPEYSRTKVINEIPFGYGRFIGYKLEILIGKK